MHILSYQKAIQTLKLLIMIKELPN